MMVASGLCEQLSESTLTSMLQKGIFSYALQSIVYLDKFNIFLIKSWVQNFMPLFYFPTGCDGIIYLQRGYVFLLLFTTAVPNSPISVDDYGSPKVCRSL